VQIAARSSGDDRMLGESGLVRQPDLGAPRGGPHPIVDLAVAVARVGPDQVNGPILLHENHPAVGVREVGARRVDGQPLLLLPGRRIRRAHRQRMQASSSDAVLVRGVGMAESADGSARAHAQFVRARRGRCHDTPGDGGTIAGSHARERHVGPARGQGEATRELDARKSPSGGILARERAPARVADPGV